jgi:hypothetical protein
LVYRGADERPSTRLALAPVSDPIPAAPTGRVEPPAPEDRIAH